MHVAAASPLWLDAAEVDPGVLRRERNVLSEKARESGKPEDIVEKMVEGGVSKFYEENVLLRQVFVMDNKTKIAKVLENAAADTGAPVKIAGFIRFALGEGLEKSEE
jgi:elongation factor Ts